MSDPAILFHRSLKQPHKYMYKKTLLSFLIREFNCVRVEHYHSSESSILQQIMILFCSCKKEKKKEEKKNNNASVEEQEVC
jgi:hypothetical protein